MTSPIWFQLLHAVNKCKQEGESLSFVVLQIMIVAAKNTKHDTSLPTEEAVHQQYRQQQIDAQHAQQAQLRAQAGHLESQIRTSGRSSKCRKCYSCEELIMHQNADAITRHLGLDTSMIMSGAACATGPTSCAATSSAAAASGASAARRTSCVGTACSAGATAGLRWITLCMSLWGFEKVNMVASQHNVLK